LNGRHVNANPVPSNETLLDSLVLVSAYIFPNQSALEGAVKDSSWQRYDNVDASSYWSTGKQDIQTADVSVTTYAYTADNLARRDGDGKKKHHYLGALAIFPIGGIGYGGWKIHDKYFKTKPGVQPTGVNVAGPSVLTLPNTPGIGPPNTIPPEILKPGTLENIITSHGTPIRLRIKSLRLTANLQLPRIDNSRISRSPITSQNSPKFQRTDGTLARNLRLGTIRQAKDRLRQINLLLETRPTLSRNLSRNLSGLTFFGIKRLLPNTILQSMWVQRVSNRLMNSRREHMTRHTQSHRRELTHRNPDLTLDQAAQMPVNRTLLTLMVSRSILTPMASRSIMMSRLIRRYVL
jgi:hypothetical protein